MHGSFEIESGTQDKLSGKSLKCVNIFFFLE